MSAEHILVVDDEPDIRGLLKEILEDEGFEVGTAASGEEARQARRKHRPDVVLADQLFNAAGTEASFACVHPGTIVDVATHHQS